MDTEDDDDDLKLYETEEDDPAYCESDETDDAYDAYDECAEADELDEYEGQEDPDDIKEQDGNEESDDRCWSEREHCQETYRQKTDREELERRRNVRRIIKQSELEEEKEKVRDMRNREMYKGDPYYLGDSSDEDKKESKKSECVAPPYKTHRERISPEQVCPHRSHNDTSSISNFAMLVIFGIIFGLLFYGLFCLIS